MHQIISRINKAFNISCNGIKNAWNSQLAFRIEVIFFIISLPCALYLSTNAIESVILISSVLLIIIVELINTAIETTIDRISLEFNELSGLAKDFASASVFFCIVNMLITWGIIIYYHFAL
jgi:diacylglycerol kinase (ATP)